MLKQEINYQDEEQTYRILCKVFVIFFSLCQYLFYDLQYRLFIVTVHVYVLDCSIFLTSNLYDRLCLAKAVLCSAGVVPQIFLKHRNILI